MMYGNELRERVLGYISEGGSWNEAIELFKVSKGTISKWHNNRPNKLDSKIKIRRNRTLDWKALELHVKEHPSALLKERAEHFGVSIRSIWYALKEMGYRRKKSSKIYTKEPS